MGKISPVSAKYIIQASIQIDGVVDRPDVIGSVFGQTEGLLGNDLELRELQRSGRIGRIEVDLDTKGGKTQGQIIIPSSLDKVETVLVAAAIETIQRIGPCNSHVKVLKVEDVRISKRSQVVDRAKELLSNLAFTVLPDSRDIKDQVSDSVKIMEAIEYGKDRCPAGPAIDESEEIIVVEGRADVLNLLKHDIKNCIALNGTNIPQTVVDLSKGKDVVVFVDGDRGGDLIVRALSAVADIDFVCKAPDGKEVEELAKKEIHKALRSRIAMEQFKLEIDGKRESLAAYNTREHTREVAPRDATPREEVAVAPATNGYNRDAPRGDRFSRDTRGGYRSGPPPREYQPRSDRGGYQQRPDTRGGYRQDRGERTERSYEPRPVQPKIAPEAMTQFKKMLEDSVGTRGAYILDDGNNVLGKVPVAELSSTLSSLTSGVHAIVMDGTITADILRSAEHVNVKFIVGMESEVERGGRVKVITSHDF